MIEWNEPGLLPEGVEVAEDAATLREIARFRYEIYVEECGRVVSGADHDQRVITDAGDASAINLYVRKEGRVVGTVRMELGGRGPIPQVVHDWFGLDAFAEIPSSKLCFVYKIMVATEWRGTPVLSSLVNACYQVARHAGIDYSFCGASPGLVKLYEALGFRRYKDNIVVEGCGYQVPMVCVLQDVDHLRAVRSPFLRVARLWHNSPEPGAWFASRFPEEIGYVSERKIPADVLGRFVTERVSHSPLFQGLSPGEIGDIAAGCTILRFNRGEVLIRPGQRECDLFLLLSGRLAVRHHDSASPVPTTGLRHGDVCGEGEFMSGGPRSTTVIAETAGQILVLSPAVTERHARRSPAAGARLAANLAAIVTSRGGVETISSLAA